MKLNETQAAFAGLIAKEYPGALTVTRQQVVAIEAKYGVARPHWLLNSPELRAGRGEYYVPGGSSKSPGLAKAVARLAKPQSPKPVVLESTVAMAGPVAIPTAPSSEPDTTLAQAMPQVQVGQEAVSLVPKRARGYVPFGNYQDVKTIIQSSKFYPLYITGLSGNGKTMMVEQVCAESNRECIRVNITEETDEDDLLGGFRLINGQTVWHNGPVVVAMERGAVLLLDEVDLGSTKLMCLQTVLEGNQIFLKKINRIITPAKGFTIVATANTKGRGSDDGKFIGTNVMNEAFLERFSITMEQEYPPSASEERIVTNIFKANDIEASPFAKILVKWAGTIREAYYAGGTSEIISTRRLVHIAEAYCMFGENRVKALQLCLSRFDTSHKTMFLELYTKLDLEVNPPLPTADTNISDMSTDKIMDEILNGAPATP